MRASRATTNWLLSVMLVALLWGFPVIEAVVVVVEVHEDVTHPLPGYSRPQGSFRMAAYPLLQLPKNVVRNGHPHRRPPGHGEKEVGPLLPLEAEPLHPGLHKVEVVSEAVVYLVRDDLIPRGEPPPLSKLTD